MVSIAQKLGISRAAISKNIKTLKDNYQIIVSSNSRVGYLLEERLDLIKVDDLAKAFKNIKYFCSVDSTSKYAIENQNNFCDNTIFISEFQTMVLDVLIESGFHHLVRIFTVLYLRRLN